MRDQAKLERKQMVLFRIVDIGTDLFAMAAAISYATMLAKKAQKNAVDLADVFCRDVCMRIDATFNNLFTDHDDEAYRQKGTAGLPGATRAAEEMAFHSTPWPDLPLGFLVPRQRRWYGCWLHADRPRQLQDGGNPSGHDGPASFAS